MVDALQLTDSTSMQFFSCLLESGVVFLMHHTTHSTMSDCAFTQICYTMYEGTMFFFVLMVLGLCYSKLFSLTFHVVRSC